MNTGKTLFAQLMDFLPWTTFTRIVARHGGDRYAKSLACAEQFRVMAFAQLTYRESLRDIEACLSAQAAKLYHMGFREPVSSARRWPMPTRSRDWRIYADFAQRLIAQAQNALRQRRTWGSNLTNTVYALDSTTIDLCLSLFPWAQFRTTKAAVKMHTLLDLRGNIPSFIHISDGKLHDVNALDLLVPEAGAIYVMDRGYLDFARLHAAASGRRLLRHPRQVEHSMPTGSIRRRQIAARASSAIRPSRSTGFYTSQDYPEHLRRIRFKDPETGKTLVFLTNRLRPCRQRPSARSTRAAGRSNCSSSGSSSICGSSSSTAPRRMR